MALDSYVFGDAPGQPGAPLILAFHGTGGDETEMIGLARRLRPDAAIVAPRGDVSEHGAARFFRRTAEGVYDRADLALRTDRMTAFVAAHKAAAGAPRVVGIGYSNGANILASVIFARPDLFDEAVLLHPLIPFDPDVKGTLAGKRILITAGRRDLICPPQFTDRLETALRAAGAGVTLAWHDGGHEVRPVEIDAAKAFLRGI